MSTTDKDADMKILDGLFASIRNTKECAFLKSSLSPLIESVKTSDSAKQSLKPYALKLGDRFVRDAKRSLLFKEDEKKEGTDEVTTLRKAFVYLGLFESSVINLIDLILMMFIATHHDFYVYNNRKYARRLDDLDNASLGEKLSFLNHHGLQIFSENLNKNLRNKIAHMEFNINPDGTISVEQQKFDLTKEILILTAFTFVIAEALASCGVPSLLAELSS